MKKSRLLIAVLAATMFVLAAFGFVACDKDAGDILGGGNDPTTITGGKYTITFVYGEGTGTPATAQTTNGKLSTLPTPTAPNGKKFDAWYDAATGGNKVTTATTFTKSGSIYARYTDNGTTPGAEYTITFMVGTDGTMSLTPNYMQTTNGKLTSLPRVTANSGYTFNGWYTESTGGTAVTLETIFDKNTTLYAQYTSQGTQPPQPESDGELLVGGQVKMYLTDNTANIQAPPEGAKATYEYYATGVQLNAGDVVTFRIKGTVLAHHNTPAEGPRMFDTDKRHGATWNQATGAFTVKSNSTGVFSIYVRYYDTGEGNEEHPCWSIEFTDGGVDQLVPGGLYLVGEGFANAGWAPSTDCYIDPDEGLTITLSAGNKIKTCHSDSAGTGAVWDMGDNTKYKEVNGTYIDFSTLDSGMGNASVTSGTHTYRITFEDGMVVFTCLD
ncbi:MAG: InlB B-repeat-containing protein [Clostridiales bacterium]|nr:InlB B-repeat-containing protein [Clostridiales bacterium]